MAYANVFSQGSLLLLFLSLSTTWGSTIIPLDACIKTQASGIPRWHIYHRMCKPIILGHRGNPKYFQENSFEGFRSVKRYGGNGLELDVVLTKDKKLVLFHDKNTLRLTGVNRNIQDMTSAEIDQLRYKKSILYGSRTCRFKRRLRLTYLDRVLRWAKGRKLLLFIDLKPETVILSPAALKNSIETGAAVAKMVKRFRMVHQVVINSFDIYAVLAAKKAFPKLVVGTFAVKDGWHLPAPAYAAIKAQMKKLMPGLKTCLDPLPADKRFYEYLYLSGTLVKSLQASFTLLDPRIINDERYGGAENKCTFNMIKRNYGRKFVAGVGGFYPIEIADNAVSTQEPKYKTIIKQGFSLLLTDDLRKTKRLVRKIVGNACNGRSRGPYHRHHRHHRHGYKYGDPKKDEQEIEAAQKQ